MFISFIIYEARSTLKLPLSDELAVYQKDAVQVFGKEYSKREKKAAPSTHPYLPKLSSADTAEAKIGGRFNG